MKTFSSFEEATDYADSNPNYGKQFTSQKPGDPAKWCVWETAAEYDAHQSLHIRAPRWVTLAEFIGLLNEFLPSVEAAILGDANHTPQPALAALKTRLMATSTENPGYINLDASELSEGLDLLIAGWGARIGFGATEKAALLS